ncbi:MAG: signal peptidase II [Pseudomonadota bacterium]
MKDLFGVRNHRIILLFLAAASCVFAIDQLSKVYIQRYFQSRETLPIIPGFFNLTFVTNTGVAFGLFGGTGHAWKRYGLLIVNVLAVGFIFYFLKQLIRKGSRPAVALGLILGGAIGNSIDRARLGNVIDFLDFYVSGFHWPAFNVADAAITCGAIYLAFLLVKEDVKSQSR